MRDPTLVASGGLVFVPGLAITVTLLALNLLGNAIRAPLDPRLSPAFPRLMTGVRRPVVPDAAPIPAAGR